MYAMGRGVPQNDAQALFWIRKAADQGYAAAQFSLGLMYANGRGVPQDYAQARAWFRKAADQGDADAQLNLGIVYGDGGRGVPQDYGQAVIWYRKAADQGIAGSRARRNLGGEGPGGGPQPLLPAQPRGGPGELAAVPRRAQPLWLKTS